MKYPRVLVLMAMAVAAASALGFAVHAGNDATIFNIVQERRSFGPSAITIRGGDALSFINMDPYAHNVYSHAPKGWFDLGIQEEGDRQVVDFAQPGTFDIRCRIHPKMRLMVTVKP